MNLPNRASGIAFALLATLLFGLNASTSAVVVASGVEPTTLVILRTGATALLCGLVVLLRNPAAFRIRKRELVNFGLLGVVGQGLMIWFYTETVSRVPVGIALLLEYTAIIMIPLAGWMFYRVRPARNLWLSVALVMLGLTIVAKVWDSELQLAGVGFGLLTAVAVTVYFVIGDRIQQERDSFSTLFHAMWIATVFWLLVARPGSTSLPPLETIVSLSGNLANLQVPLWLLLLWVAVIGSFLPFFFAFSALRHLSANVMGIISTSETLFAFLFGWLWLAQGIDGIQALGGMLVIAGILLAQILRGRSNRSHGHH